MDIALARQFASFVGALLILIAYAGHQLRWIDARSAGYNIFERDWVRHPRLHCLLSFPDRVRGAGSGQ